MSTRTTARLSQSARGSSLQDQMAATTDPQRQIINETLQAAQRGQITESGRTLCPSQGTIYHPVARMPTSVKVQSCPVGVSGAWHTHVTRSELRNPRNSLPDIATVVLGQLDVMAVVGTETAEYVVGSEDREYMRERFSDAVGIEVTEMRDLMDAVRSGQLSLVDAQDSVRADMSHLFVTEQTGFSDLGEKVSEIGVDDRLEQVAYSNLEVQLFYNQPQPVQATMFDPRKRASATADGLRTAINEHVPGDVWEMAIGAAVGTVVGNLVEAAISQ